MTVLRRTAAVRGVPLLRVVRRGDRHNVRDLIADIEVTLHNAASAVAGGRLEGIVHALAPAHAGEEPERFARAIALHCIERIESTAAVRVDIVERGWARLELSGRPRDTDLIGGTGPLRTARAVVDGGRERVFAGCRDLRILASAGEGSASVIALQLHAQWAYGWTEVPFDPQWQQVRRALTEAYAERSTADPGELAHALASAVLEQSPAVCEMEVTLETRQRPALDLTAFGMERDTVFGDEGAARGVHTVVVTREEISTGG